MWCISASEPSGAKFMEIMVAFATAGGETTASAQDCCPFLLHARHSALAAMSVPGFSCSFACSNNPGGGALLLFGVHDSPFELTPRAPHVVIFWGSNIFDPAALPRLT